MSAARPRKGTTAIHLPRLEAILPEFHYLRVRERTADLHSLVEGD